MLFIPRNNPAKSSRNNYSPWIYQLSKYLSRSILKGPHFPYTFECRDNLGMTFVAICII